MQDARARLASVGSRSPERADSKHHHAAARAAESAAAKAKERAAAPPSDHQALNTARADVAAARAETEACRAEVAELRATLQSRAEPAPGASQSLGGRATGVRGCLQLLSWMTTAVGGVEAKLDRGVSLSLFTREKELDRGVSLSSREKDNPAAELLTARSPASVTLKRAAR